MSADALDAPPRAPRRWLHLTLALCVVTFIATLFVLRDRDAIKNPDEASYCEQADSLLRDGSLSVGFVRYFHEKYPAGIDHPEDFYPPGNGALIAAAWRLFGRDDAVSAFPSALMACVLLPLIVFALSRRFGASQPFAFVAAISVMFDVTIRDHAFEAMADLPLTVAATAALLTSLKPGLLPPVWSGLLLATGFWLKPTALLFLPGLGLALILAERQTLRQCTARLLVFGAVFLLACLPWLLRNHTLFGSYLYSGNMHLTAAANDPNFVYSDIRKVHWFAPGKELPALGTSYFAHGILPVVKRFMLHVYEIIVVHGIYAFGGIFVLAALSLWRRRHAAAALAWVVLYLGALSAVFAIFYRYLLPVLPVVIALNWSFIDSLVRRLGQTDFGNILDRHFASPARASLLLAAIVAIPGGAELARDLATGREFVQQPDLAMHAAARWSREHLPAESTVMIQEALVFRHVSGLRSVDTPFDEPDAIEAVIAHYGVDYLVTVESGQFSEMSTQFVFPYLEQYRTKWRRIDPDGNRFSVWIREGAPDPH